jgi:TctA family transporter
MGDLNNLLNGFSVAFEIQNLAYAFFGVLIGTMVGVLPGIGPVTAVALLLPATYTLAPAAALIMLAGIYYGASYGGSTTAILVKLPGESSSVVTCLDGYQMARQGRAGAALGIAAIGSFVAGTISTFVIALVGPALAEIALNFGPAEYFALMVLGLTAAVSLTEGPLLKSAAMVFIGLLLGLIGTDTNSGTARFAWSIPELANGIDFVIVAMGLFGLSEIIRNFETDEKLAPITTTIGRILPTRDDLRRSWAPVLRGTALGSVLGILPGGGALLSSFASYALERRLSKHPEQFGKGAIEGVAGPESANNAGAQTSFIPLLTLGLPGNPTMAMMFGALMIQGITPGPMFASQRPDLFWGLIASMWIGNLMLVVLNMPLIGLWIRLLKVPNQILFPAIVLFSCAGVYSINQSPIDVALLSAMAIFGYAILKLGFEPSPLVLGFVLGPMMEEYLRRGMNLARGDVYTFVSRPICATLLLMAAALLVIVLWPRKTAVVSVDV